MAMHITDADFDTTISSGITLVDFWAEWCGPCRMLAPVIEELATDFEGQAKIGKIDVDTNPEASMKYGVRSIPTVLIFKDGTLVDKVVGFATKVALASKINAAILA